MNTVQDLIAASSDPCLLVRDGKVAWENAAAAQLANSLGCPTLGDCITAETWPELRSSAAFSSVSLVLQGAEKLQVRQTALIVDVSSGGLDDEASLIFLKSAPSEEVAASEQLEWLATAVHDLKNPLGAIFGYADTLLDTPTGNDLSENHRHLINRIRASAHRALELMRNIQLLSVVELRGHLPRGTSCNLEQSVRNVVDMTWREDPVSPQVDLDLDPRGILVRMDRGQLERIVSNLFSNALKFSPPDDVVAVKSCRSGSDALLIFRNGGNIIPPDELAQLFGRYKRLNNSRNIPGSGLGLYIVKQLITAAGGSIEASSTPEGTSFKLKLPALPDLPEVKTENIT